MVYYRRLSSQISCPDNDESDADDDLDVVSNPPESCVASPSEDGAAPHMRVSESPESHSINNGKCARNHHVKLAIRLNMIYILGYIN